MERILADQRKYRFRWELLGDVVLGRPNLGTTTSVEVYRLNQFTLRDVLEQNYGTEEAERLIYQAGRLGGHHFFHNMLGGALTLDQFFCQLVDALQSVGIGILRVEKADPDAGIFVFTISEDLDCSGLPELDYEVCGYDEGFISGILEEFTGKTMRVREIDCWCTGDRTCRFTTEPL